MEVKIKAMSNLDIIGLIDSFPPKSLEYVYDCYDRKAFWNYTSDKLMEIYNQLDPREKTKKLYSFYTQHPESNVLHPEQLGLTPEDVSHYFDNLALAAVKLKSKMLDPFKLFIDLIRVDDETFWHKPSFYLFWVFYVVWASILLFFAPGVEIWQALIVMVGGLPGLAISYLIAIYGIHAVCCLCFNAVLWYILYRYEKNAQKGDVFTILRAQRRYLNHNQQK